MTESFVRMVLFMPLKLKKLPSVGKRGCRTTTGFLEGRG